MLLLCCASAFALSVHDLRVQTQKNPEGVDRSPEFSWKLASDQRGILQTAYKIVVSTDADGGNVVFDSGFRESGQSVGVTLDGLNLQAATRYYWQVSVRDNKGNETTSTEEAWFDTGLLSSGWSGAQWLRATNVAYGQTVPEDDVDAFPKDGVKEAASHYTVDFDMQLVNASAAIVFGHTSSNSYYMWQINCHDNPKATVRHHVYTNGNLTSHDDAQFDQFSKTDLLGSLHHYRVEVENRTIKTYIDSKLVDTYTAASVVPLGETGFRVHSDAREEAWFDNIVVTDLSGGQQKVVLSDDFEQTSDNFLTSNIAQFGGSRMLHMYATAGESLLLQLSKQGVPMFRKAFTLGKEVKSAKLFTSGLGVYDLWINGQRVGHVKPEGTVYEELKPGFTDFRSHLFYSSHDVTTLLRQGRNAIGALVGSGWYSGTVAHGIAGSAENLGIIAKLVVTYTDGSTETIVSDGSWMSSFNGPMLYSDIYNGEIYDARRYQDISSPDYDASGWNAVAASNAFRGELVSMVGPYPQQLTKHIAKVKTATVYEGTKATGTDHGMANVVATQSGEGTVKISKQQAVCFDFGQNVAGWPRFTVKGKAGTRLHFALTEMLNDTGAKSRGNDGPGGTPYLANLRSAKAEIYYTLRGDEDGESWHSSTSFYGYRYCTITTTDDVEIVRIESVPVSSSNEDTGALTTSHDMVNRLQSNIVWGQRGNLLSAPTDCPQRDERQGWTADTQVYAQTGMYNANLREFYNKFLMDMRDGQRSDGAFPDVAPQTGYAGYGGSGWSDAHLIVTWDNYRMYGDKQAVADNWAAMEKYMQWMGSQTGDGNYQGGLTTYGDWVAYTETDRRFISMVYYAHNADLMARMARVLSSADGDAYDKKAKDYEELFGNIRNAIQNRYFNGDGSPKLTTQCALVLILNFKIYKDEAQKQLLVKELDKRLKESGDVLNTGFLGTSVLNQTLSEYGLNDHAYSLLLQDKNPSWFYPINQGGTTMWERWDSYTKEKGFQTPVMNSFNHYAYGAVGEWMYRYMCGIEVDESKPGFKHIVLQPRPDFRATIPEGQERVTQASASYDSQYGLIRSEWSNNNGKRIDYSCEVPANTTATLYLPADAAYAKALKEGKAEVDMEGITYVDYKDGIVMLELGSGKYTFGNAATGI